MAKGTLDEYPSLIKIHKQIFIYHAYNFKK